MKKTLLALLFLSAQGFAFNITAPLNSFPPPLTTESMESYDAEKTPSDIYNQMIHDFADHLRSKGLKLKSYYGRREEAQVFDMGLIIETPERIDVMAARHLVLDIQNSFFKTIIQNQKYSHLFAMRKYDPYTLLSFKIVSTAPGNAYLRRQTIASTIMPTFDTLRCVMEGNYAYYYNAKGRVDEVEYHRTINWGVIDYKILRPEGVGYLNLCHETAKTAMKKIRYS